MADDVNQKTETLNTLCVCGGHGFSNQIGDVVKVECSDCGVEMQAKATSTLDPNRLWNNIQSYLMRDRVVREELIDRKKEKGAIKVSFASGFFSGMDKERLNKKLKPGSIIEMAPDVMVDFDKITPFVELVIIRGLPGSGKSTLAKTAFPDHLHYEPDHLFSDTNGRYLFDAQLFDKAKAFVLSMTDYALSRGDSVVVSDVFPKIEELKPYVDLANYHDASIRVIYTNADYGNVHRVPKYVLDDMLNVFEANEVQAYESVGIKAESVSSDVYFLVGQ